MQQDRGSAVEASPGLGFTVMGTMNMAKLSMLETPHAPITTCLIKQEIGFNEYCTNFICSKQLLLKMN